MTTLQDALAAVDDAFSPFALLLALDGTPRLLEAWNKAYALIPDRIESLAPAGLSDSEREALERVTLSDRRRIRTEAFEADIRLLLSALRRLAAAPAGDGDVQATDGLGNPVLMRAGTIRNPTRGKPAPSPVGDTQQTGAVAWLEPTPYGTGISFAPGVLAPGYVNVRTPLYTSPGARVDEARQFVVIARAESLKRHLQSVGAHADYLGYCDDIVQALTAALTAGEAK